MIDVNAIDFLNLSEAYRPADGIMLDLESQFSALFLIQNFLRVVEAAQFVIVREDNCAGDYRPGQRRHARFVDAGHQPVAPRPEIDFKAQQRMQALPFSAIAAIAFTDLFCELLRAVAIVGLERPKQTPGHPPLPLKEYFS